MGDRRRLSSVTVDRGEYARTVIADCLADDNEIKGPEVPALLDAVEDWLQSAKTTDRADALADAVRRGVGAGDPRYFDSLVDGYRQELDELEELPPAA